MSLDFITGLPKVVEQNAILIVIERLSSKQSQGCVTVVGEPKLLNFPFWFDLPSNDDAALIARLLYIKSECPTSISLDSGPQLNQSGGTHLERKGVQLGWVCLPFVDALRCPNSPFFQFDSTGHCRSYSTGS